MKCPDCGRSNFYNARSCAWCGVSLQPPPAPPASRPNVVLIGLLCLAVVAALGFRMFMGANGRPESEPTLAPSGWAKRESASPSQNRRLVPDFPPKQPLPANGDGRFSFERSGATEKRLAHIRPLARDGRFFFEPSAAATEVADLPPEQPLPANGDGWFSFDRSAAHSKLRIVPANAQQHVMIKVKPEDGTNLVCWFFIWAGQSAETPIAPGSYRLNFAFGTRWYGESNLVGPHTSYSAIANPIRIPEMTAYTVSLSHSPAGALRETRLRPDEF